MLEPNEQLNRVRDWMGRFSFAATEEPGAFGNLEMFLNKDIYDQAYRLALTVKSLGKELGCNIFFEEYTNRFILKTGGSKKLESITCNCVAW